MKEDTWKVKEIVNIDLMGASTTIRKMGTITLETFHFRPPERPYIQRFTIAKGQVWQIISLKGY